MAPPLINQEGRASNVAFLARDKERDNQAKSSFLIFDVRS